jgi:hypothetical protein
MISLITLHLLACGPKHVEMSYSVRRPTGSWRSVQEGGADYAWYNRDLSAVIYVDANCEKKFEDRELKDSIQSLTQGISDGAPISSSEMTIDSRVGRFEIHNGILDGVTVQMGVALVSKNNCLYDFVYIAPPNRFDLGLSEFLSLTQSFQTHSQAGFKRTQEEATPQ